MGSDSLAIRACRTVVLDPDGMASILLCRVMIPSCEDDGWQHLRLVMDGAAGSFHFQPFGGEGHPLSARVVNMLKPLQNYCVVVRSVSESR